MIADLAKKLAAPFPGTWDRTYVASKVKTDPLYGAVYEELRTSELPLLDLGCGLGLLAFYLRERGLNFPVRGLDYDSRKIDSAQKVAAALAHPGLFFDALQTRFQGSILGVQSGSFSFKRLIFIGQIGNLELLLLDACDGCRNKAHVAHGKHSIFSFCDQFGEYLGYILSQKAHFIQTTRFRCVFSASEIIFAFEVV